ncbi:MAG: hypothetical protein CMJ32_09010 [Phycisphaerae bacterium]|nr:hypothetical protein [Phycisphaerae bacterium]
MEHDQDMNTGTTAASPAQLIGFILCRLIVPCWVLLGAVFKLVEGNPLLLPKPIIELLSWSASTLGIQNPEAWLGFWMSAIIAVELAAAVLMFLLARAARWIAASILVIFMLTLLVLMIQQLANGGFSELWKGTCGCLGNSSPRPWVMFLIDGAMLVGVLALKPPPATTGSGENRGLGIAAIAGCIIAFIVPFVIGTGGTSVPEVAPNGGEVQASGDGWPEPPPVAPFYFPQFDQWLGTPLSSQPLAQQINRPLPSDIDEGTWLLVFYSPTCDHCYEFLSNYFAESPLPHRTIVVELPAEEGNPVMGMPCGDCIEHKLPPDSQYVLTPPAMLRIEDGIVECAIFDGSIDDPVAVEDCLR